jgi:hypothetical protein
MVRSQLGYDDIIFVSPTNNNITCDIEATLLTLNLGSGITKSNTLEEEETFIMTVL